MSPDWIVEMQKSNSGLDLLEVAIERDFEYLNFPPNNWVIPSLADDGSPLLDVLIVGGGMCGMAANFALRRLGITNIRTIDSNPKGLEGPWLTYARMETLRSPKHLTGPALGLPNLTFRAWFEAQYGQTAWDELGRIPRTQWADYLTWYRDVTGVQIENGKTLTDLATGQQHIQATVTDSKTDQTEIIAARRVVLATGRDALARPRIPDVLAPYLGVQVLHTSHAPAASEFANKSVAVIGLAASAFDYAAEALEAGARSVKVLGRANRIPRVNKAKQIVYPGFSFGFSELADEERFALFEYIASHGVPPPRDTVLRVSRHNNFELVLGAEVSEAIPQVDGLRLITQAGEFDVGVVVLGTGFHIDVSATPFLGAVGSGIATWADRLDPSGRNQELLNFPHLGSGFEFSPRTDDETASSIRRIHCFNHAAMVSLGNLANDIPAVSEGAAHLANAIATHFFKDDHLSHRSDLEDFVEPELLGDELPASQDW